MKIYLRGVILSVSEPEIVGQNGTRIQHCVIQHEFNQEVRYNKYAFFDVIGDRIEQLALKPQDDVELAIDLNARMGNAGRWFNSLTAFGVERDKKKFHYYENNKQRVAVMPQTNEDSRVKSEESKSHSQAPAVSDDPLAEAAGAADLPY